MVYSNVYTGSFTGWNSNNNYWDNGTNYITVSYNQQLNGWVAEKTYYWPDNNRLLAFAAYSPAELRPYSNYDEEKKEGTIEKINDEDVESPTVNYTSTGLSITGFKVANNPAYQFELLYSKRSLGNYANQSSATGEYAGTPIEFQHALSSIHFAIIKDPAVTDDIILKKIELVGVKHTGNFNENIDQETPTVYKAAPQWSQQSGSADYTAYDAGSSNGISFPTTSAQHVHDVSSKIEGDESYALLLLPQELVGEDVEVQLKVTYAIGTGEGAEKDPVIVTLGTQIGQEDYKDDKPKITVNKWEPGVKYTYVLHYSATSAAKDMIVFAPETGGWKEVRLINVELH